MKTTITIALSLLIATSAFATPEVSDANPPKTANSELNFNLKPLQFRRGPYRGNTIWGATGLIAVPTAFTQSPRSAAFGVNFSEDLSSGYVNVGFFEGFEAGVALFDRPGNNDHGILNAKFHVPLTNTDRFQLGIGALDLADQDGQSFYIVASSAITVPDEMQNADAVGLNLHFGLGSGYFDGHVFGGAEIFFAQGFNILAEWDANDFNAGLRYQFNPQFTGEVGLYSSNPYLKLGYTIQF